MNLNYLSIILLGLLLSLVVYTMKHNSPQKNNTVTIGFVGDLMLGRLVNEHIAHYGHAYPWGNTLPILNATDFNIANLETTLTKSIQKVPKVFNFKSDPNNVASLKLANIKIVSLANNHILDFGNKGLIETIDTLNQESIEHVGAGINKQEAKKPVLIEKNNLQIGIIGYTDYPKDWAAQENKPGTNVITIDDIKTVQHDIRQLKKDADIVIVSIHWGPNMRQRPTQKFVDFAHAMIDAGADIIHGHSAHIFQGIEVYKNKLIMYDTGDFVDDYHVARRLRNDQSALFKVTIDKNGIQKVKIIPVLISNMQVNLAGTNDKKEVIARIQKVSKEFNTFINRKGELDVR